MLRFYALLFCGFVGLHVALPHVMGRTLQGAPAAWLGELNLALILGLGLILGAILLAVIHFPRRP